MVQPGQDCDDDNDTGPLDRPTQRCILVQCQVRARLIVRHRIRSKNSPQVLLTEDQHPVQALAAHGADQAFCMTILPGCQGRRGGSDQRRGESWFSIRVEGLSLFADSTCPIGWCRGVRSILSCAQLAHLCREKHHSQTDMNTQSTITCPKCGHQAIERMPRDACQIVYDCKRCGERLRPKPGDCCVFCSYASVPCPPVQSDRCLHRDLGGPLSSKRRQG